MKNTRLKLIQNFFPELALKISILLFCPLIFYSCFSLSINKRLDVNENEDWLMIGGNPEKTNISKSDKELVPPFKLQWQFDTDGGLSRNCLSVSDAVLFVNTLNGEFYSVDVSSGKSLGSFSVPGKSSFSTPLISGNNVIITSSGNNDSRILSYSLTRGEIDWKRNIGWVQSSPLLLNNNIFVSNISGDIYKLNASGGNIIWKCRAPSSSSFYTGPAISGNKILIGGTDGILYAFDQQSGSFLWKYKTEASLFSDASVYKEMIFFGSDDNYFYCLDTAGVLIWKKNLKTKYLSSPSYYANSIIITGIDGTIYSLDINSGEIRWKFTTKGAMTASPLIHQNKIFAGSFDKNFYCINADDGKELWRYGCEGRVQTSAVVWKDYIFVASDDKYIYCFK